MTEVGLGLEDKAFPFLRVVPRSAKPRVKGLTVIADRGIGPNAISDLMMAAGDYVDWAKVGISAPRIHTRQFLKDKMALFHRNDVNCFIAGDAFEAAILQGVANQYFEEVLELGADGVEVSSAQIMMPLDSKVRLVKKAASMGLKVFAEVGKKGFDKLDARVNDLANQVNACLEAGAYRVVVQGEGLIEGVPEIRSDLLLDLAARVDVDKLVFQAKDTRAHVWFISTFGNEVSLDIDTHQVVDVELLRRGIRKRGIFGLLANYQEGQENG